MVRLGCEGEEVNMMTLRRNRAQATVEYAVVIVFVVAALVFMGIYIQRASQGAMKSGSDSVGQQFSTNASWNLTSSSTQNEVSGVVTSNSNSEYTHSPQ